MSRKKIHSKVRYMPPTAGSQSTVEGLKLWNWSDVTITEPSNADSNTFENSNLRTNSHCNTGMVTIEKGRLHFLVNPTTPAAQGWCSYSYNYRAEIRENPSGADHAIGTEQWMGWDYKFEDGYIADALHPFIMFQNHGSFSSPSSPLFSLWVGVNNQASTGSTAGEIIVVNAAIDSANNKYTRTFVVPQAGDKINIVVYVKYGTDANGELKVWINGQVVYDEQERTVFVENPIGGYNKWGIYKWRWQDEPNVTASAGNGITEEHTSMGNLRMITRTSSHPDYGVDSFEQVAPF